jgi:hypothetical protein
LSQSTGDKTFTDTTGSRDDQVLVVADPIAGRQTADELAVEAAGMTIVDVFDGGVDFEPCIFQAADERLVLSPVPLLVHEQSQTFFEAEPRDFGIFHVAADGFGHADQFHGIEFFDGRLH